MELFQKLRGGWAVGAPWFKICLRGESQEEERQQRDWKETATVSATRNEKYLYFTLRVLELSTDPDFNE